MTPQAALIELLARVGVLKGDAVLISEEELSLWPAAAVAAMKSQGLLGRARHATRAICPGCERECSMRVHTVPTRPGGPPSFIVCDRRSDINRVPVSAARLTQWRCDADAVRRFIASSLALRLSDRCPADAGLLNIGIASGDKRRQMLCLRTEGELILVAGNGEMPLPELVGFRDGEYTVDVAMVRQLVNSATIADPRYTPSNARREARKLDTQAKREGWRKAYRDLKKRRPNMSDVWYSQQIAKQPNAAGRKADTIRKHMTN